MSTRSLFGNLQIVASDRIQASIGENRIGKASFAAEIAGVFRRIRTDCYRLDTELL